MKDPINHPDHYTDHPSGIECIAVTEHFNFNLGNAIKYIWRAGKKGALVEDLKKAVWYLLREIRRLGGSVDEITVSCPKWIRCEERLPEMGRLVWGCDISQNIKIYRREIIQGKEWMWAEATSKVFQANNTFDATTHPALNQPSFWFPFPEHPYKTLLKTN